MPNRKLVPPLNFAPVERQLYRSGEPRAVNLQFLETLGLKTIAWLAAEDPNDSLLSWADDNDVIFEHLGLLAEGCSPWDPLTDETIRAALRMLLNKDNYPLLLCCSMGRHRTGTVVGCLRKLQGWSFASLIDEYQRSSGLRGERASVELVIENYEPEEPLAQLLKRYPNAPLWWHRGLPEQDGTERDAQVSPTLK